MLDWLWHNREWVFSGVGVALVLGIVGWLRNKRQLGSKLSQRQRSGNNSINIQVGRDMNSGGGKRGR